MEPRTATFRIARQTGGYSLFARVSVSLLPGVGAITCPAGGPWETAARLGVQAAGLSADTTITEITGTFADTTDEAVAAAALCAVRSAAGLPTATPQQAADWARGGPLAPERLRQLLL